MNIQERTLNLFQNIIKVKHLFRKHIFIANKRINATNISLENIV